MASNGAAELNVTIGAPNIETIVLKLRGASPYVCARFSQKVQNILKERHEAGSTSKSKKAKEARDFTADYEGSMYIAEKGWAGIPAGAFRTAAISACRLVGYKMTLAKLSVFVVADGFDKFSGTPLVKIEGTPEMNISPVRNATGVLDLRARAMWREWSVNLKMRYDADQFKASDVVNLIARVGQQVGIGEGRHDSRESCGCGWGTFTIENT